MMIPYITKNDLELMFGTENVTRWADLDGDGIVQKITDRVNFAILAASSEIDAVLRGRNYKDVLVNPMIKRLAAQKAALNLYDAKGLISSEAAQDALSEVRRQYNDTITRIRTGQVILQGDRTQSLPFVVPAEQVGEDARNGNLPRSPFYGSFLPPR